MAEEQQKSKVIPIYQPFKQASRLRTRRFMNLAIIGLIVLAAVLSSIFVTDYANRSHQSAVNKSIRLVYGNAPQGQLALADNSGKIISHKNIPKNSAPRFEAMSPDGTVLVSLNAPGPLESYILLGDAGQTLKPEAAKALKAADFLNDTHHIVYLDDRTLAYVACTAGKSCQVIKLDLNSGTTKQVVDTGLMKNGFTSYVYLLGKSDDGRTLYLRVNGPNKIGKEKSAVYRLDAGSGNSRGVTKVDQTAGFNLSLSPDQKRLAFASIDTSGTKNITLATKLHVIDMAAGNDKTTTWTRIGVGNQSDSLRWSPDGTKLLFDTGMALSASGSTAPPAQSYIAYLDIAKDKIVELQTINGNGSGYVGSIGWLDDKNIIYDMAAVKTARNQYSVQDQIYKQDIASKEAAKFGGPQNTLLQAAYR